MSLDDAAQRSHQFVLALQSRGYGILGTVGTAASQNSMTVLYKDRGLFWRVISERRQIFVYLSGDGQNWIFLPDEFVALGSEPASLSFASNVHVENWSQLLDLHYDSIVQRNRLNWTEKQFEDARTSVLREIEYLVKINAN